MAKRIVTALFVVGLLIAGYWSYTRYLSAARMRDGDVASGEVRDADGNAVHATPSRSDTPGTVNTEAVGTRATGSADTQSASLAQLQQQANPAASTTDTAPATDSQTPNAPNGVAFAGTGQYQVYRQGNLTWRINTADGSTCILFATNEEWRKPVVYNHGCPNG